MNAEEGLMLTRLVRGAFPAQRFDEYTIDTWVAALADEDFGSAQEAVARLVKVQTFVSVAEIIAEVRRVKRDAHRQIADRRVFAQIEQAKANTSRPVQRAGYEAATAALQAKLRELHPEDENEPEPAS